MLQWTERMGQVQWCHHSLRSRVLYQWNDSRGPLRLLHVRIRQPAAELGAATLRQRRLANGRLQLPRDVQHSRMVRGARALGCDRRGAARRQGGALVGKGGRQTGSAAQIRCQPIRRLAGNETGPLKATRTVAGAVGSAGFSWARVYLEALDRSSTHRSVSATNAGGNAHGEEAEAKSRDAHSADR